jgi:hypothetical protein
VFPFILLGAAAVPPPAIFFNSSSLSSTVSALRQWQADLLPAAFATSDASSMPSLPCDPPYVRSLVTTAFRQDGGVGAVIRSTLFLSRDPALQRSGIVLRQQTEPFEFSRQRGCRPDGMEARCRPSSWLWPFGWNHWCLEQTLSMDKSDLQSPADRGAGAAGGERPAPLTEVVAGDFVSAAAY